MDRLISTLLVFTLLAGCVDSDPINPTPRTPFVANMLTASDTLRGISTLDFKFLYLEEGESFEVRLGDQLIYFSTFNGIPGDTVYKRMTFDSFEYPNGLYPLSYTLALASGEEVVATSEVSLVNIALTVAVDNYLTPNQFGDLPLGLIYISDANGWELREGSYSLNNINLYYRDYEDRWRRNGDQYFVHFGYSIHNFHSRYTSFVVESREITHWNLSRESFFPDRPDRLSFEVATTVPFQDMTLGDNFGSIISHWDGTSISLPFQAAPTDLLVSYFSPDYNTYAYEMYPEVSNTLVVDLEDYQSSEVLKMPSAGWANTVIKGYNTAGWEDYRFDLVNMYRFTEFFVPTGIQQHGTFEAYYSHLTSEENNVTHEQHQWGGLPTEMTRREISYDFSRQDDVLRFDFSNSPGEIVELVLRNDRQRYWNIFIPKTLREFVIPSRLDFVDMEVKEIIFHESPGVEYEHFRALHAESQYELSPSNFSSYLKTTYKLE